MPVLRGDLGEWPKWCELRAFAIVSIGPGEARTWRAGHQKNKLVTVEGECWVDAQHGSRVVDRGASVDVQVGNYMMSSKAGATVVELGGSWGDDCGGAGIFGVKCSDEPDERGDPVSYPKHTRFDRHYHDCDEYWIVVSGRGTASSEDVLYEVSSGDCVATRMGYHHDFPLVDEPVLAVFFETTMRGQRRRGHLWEHTHGPAL